MAEIDLTQPWEEHTQHEFATRDTESTVDPMVENAYVNQVPVLTVAPGPTAPCAISIRATLYPACRRTGS